MKAIWLIAMLSLVVLSGCADPYRNLYEGMQQRESIANPVAKSAENHVPYDQYKAERDSAQEKSSKKSHGSVPAH
jgi:hypothetical protein